MYVLVLTASLQTVQATLCYVYTSLPVTADREREKPNVFCDL